jgi:adenylosuccinate lyase
MHETFTGLGVISILTRDYLGTQASFMAIFNNDGEKIDALNKILCEKAGFPSCYSISTQTYSRKVDLRVANALAAYGATVQRITSDIRHLAAQKEMEEPFEKDQIGSSAMAYKRNPMRCERIAGLGRHLANLNKNASDTYRYVISKPYFFSRSRFLTTNETLL